MMRACLPSVQYSTPRDTLRGARSPRCPSSRRYTHSVSPVAASIATTFGRNPAVVYSTPPTISGVASMLFCGRGPKFSDFHRHATLRSFTLSRLIWSSAEYLLFPRSAPQWGHSPFVTPDWPETITDAPMSTASNGSSNTYEADRAVMEAPLEVMSRVGVSIS